MNYIYPIAHALNSYSTTGIIVVCGIAGYNLLAADIALTQAALMALFFSLSANARSLILSDDNHHSPISFFKKRTILVMPLMIISIFISMYVSGVGIFIAAIISIRKSSEWLSEIVLSLYEKQQNNIIISIVLTIEVIFLFATVISIFLAPALTIKVILIWSILPLLLVIHFLLHLDREKQSGALKLQLIMPHITSTLIIGMTVFIFRNMILFFTNKNISGEIFVAIAIGGLVANLFSTSFGPSVVLHKARNSENKLPLIINFANTLTLLIGIALICYFWVFNSAAEFFGKTEFFWTALGCSLVGSFIMVYAIEKRLNILQLLKDKSVLVPDSISNFLILLQVPVLYMIFGSESFVALYIGSAIINLLVYEYCSKQ